MLSRGWNQALKQLYEAESGCFEACIKVNIHRMDDAPPENTLFAPGFGQLKTIVIQKPLINNVHRKSWSSFFPPFIRTAGNFGEQTEIPGRLEVKAPAIIRLGALIFTGTWSSFPCSKRATVFEPAAILVEAPEYSLVSSHKDGYPVFIDMDMWRIFEITLVSLIQWGKCLDIALFKVMVYGIIVEGPPLWKISKIYSS